MDIWMNMKKEVKRKTTSCNKNRSYKNTVFFCCRQTADPLSVELDNRRFHDQGKVNIHSLIVTYVEIRKMLNCSLVMNVHILTCP
jgi:hypothetical protein